MFDERFRHVGGTAAIGALHFRCEPFDETADAGVGVARPDHEEAEVALDRLEDGHKLPSGDFLRDEKWLADCNAQALLGSAIGQDRTRKLVPLDGLRRKASSLEPVMPVEPAVVGGEQRYREKVLRDVSLFCLR